ncbi:MAG: Ig-like domain-containing protein [Gaiellaceae bacterium]
MNLRTFGDLDSTPRLRHGRLRLLAVLAGAVVLLTLLAGGSGAGIAAYQGTLYFAGPASSISGSFQLTAAAPGAQGTTPVASQGAIGSGGLAAGSYRWIYVTSSGGAQTASLTSNQLTVSGAGNTPVNVANVPAGADVYRARIMAGNSGTYTYVGTNPGPGTTYVDTNTSTAGAVLPQADTRVPLATAGWMEFLPGTNPGTGDSSVSGSTPSIPSTCTGWTVDSSAGFTFPAGTWTFQRRLRPDAVGTGTAVLSVAMWKVDTSGNTIAGGTIIPVTDGGSIALNGANQTVSVSYTSSTATTLDTNERLCVQFWRHQTNPTTGGGLTSRGMWMLAWDPNSQLTLHPAPNAFASASLSSPADGVHTQATQPLAATYADSEGDSGNLTIRLCTDSACSSSPQSSGAIAANNGDTKPWTPTGPLADGTYYWQARAQDAGGLPSAWTSSRSFVIDNAAPTVTIDTPPPVSSNAASGTIAFSPSETVTGSQCHVDAAAFASCASPAPYGPLADGPHTFYVKATADLAGNVGTTTSYSWTIDTVPPNTSITSQPSALSNTSSPSFSFSSTQSGSTFECDLGGGFSPCASPKTYSGVADGSHTFQVRAIDPAGNVDGSPASYVWTIDATPPDTTIGPGTPSSPTTATSALFSFTSTEAGSTFTCSLDGALFTACSSPKSYSALADGPHMFQVRATDTATNNDPAPATHAWTIDTTPPVTSIGPTAPSAHTQATSATFDLASNEGASTFECRLDGGLYSACTTPQTYTGLADGSHTFDVRAKDSAGNLDATPASYAWAIDRVAPSTPTLVGPVDGTLTNTLPQLRATFADATAGGDTGTVQFQICTSSAPAGTACAPVAQSGASGAVPSASTAPWTPAALADGTYNWQARAQDSAGNLSGWSATRSFTLDTVVPGTVLDAPNDGASSRSVELRATFDKPAGAGTIEFRICSDAMCLNVVRSSISASLTNGGQATWTPSPALADGTWYWQARSVDKAGNSSVWSAARMLRVDTTPAKAPSFSGDVTADGLVLHIGPPDDNVANYVLYVNGVAWKNLATTETDVNMGAFDQNDLRTFSVLAIDTAGNVGAMSPTLVGVPNLVGLNWAQALGATSARELGLKRDAIGFASIPMFVTSQDPAMTAVAARGTSVHVTMAVAKGSPLAVRVTPGSIKCKRTCVLKLRVELSSSADVRSRLLTGRGRVVKRNRLGTLSAGTNTVRVQLPGGLGRGAYRLVLDASGDAGTAHASVRVNVG